MVNNENFLNIDNPFTDYLTMTKQSIHDLQT